MKNLNDTAHKILDAAQTMVMTKGFNGFSYKDLQKEVGVKTSTMHYYFPAKQDLAAALLERHNTELLEFLNNTNRSSKTGLEKIYALGELFVGISRQDKFCLCGMLASDLLSMSDDGIKALKCFFYETESWLAGAIQQGIDEGEIRDSLDPKKSASSFLAILEGGILIARAHEDQEYMKSIVDQALLFLKK